MTVFLRNAVTKSKLDASYHTFIIEITFICILHQAAWGQCFILHHIYSYSRHYCPSFSWVTYTIQVHLCLCKPISLQCEYWFLEFQCTSMIIFRKMFSRQTYCTYLCCAYPGILLFYLYLYISIYIYIYKSQSENKNDYSKQWLDSQNNYS